ncbi:MAG: metal-dependent transcriptional regulator [bacterium]
MKNKTGIHREELTSNMEDYLETIYELASEQGESKVRVTDIARRLGVTRPSVVGMVKHLEEHGTVSHTHYGGISLTKNGKKIAKDVLNRHRVLRRFLEEVLGLDAQVAEEDACRMEHTLSQDTIERFVALEEFREGGPDQGLLKGESFRRFLREKKLSSRKGTASESE